MEAEINIGTTKGNIVGVTFNKPFNEITFKDVMQVVYEKYGKAEKVQLIGWCLTPSKEN